MHRAAHSTQQIDALTLRNTRGDTIRILTLGAILSEFKYVSRHHGEIDLILGYPHEQSYLQDTAYHGAIAGRYSNRISNSTFTLDGQTFRLDSNEGLHHLHGGSEGFNRKLWTVEKRQENMVSLRLLSPDGDQGYPGNLDVLVNYRLDDAGTLNIEWQATTDQDTIVGLTSHGYFNLSGHGDILDHYLRIPADHVTPVNDELIPTGEIRRVDNTVFDFRQFTELADVITSDHSEIAAHGGIDHNWAFETIGKLDLRAQLLSPHTNLLLSVSSTLPGLQCYSANHLMDGGVHGSHEGICLEPQYYPDSPNQPLFPSPLLKAGETISHRIRYKIDEVDAGFLQTIT